MKKLITLFTVLFALTVSAQNFQLHNDFERGHLTSTFEIGVLPLGMSNGLTP